MIGGWKGVNERQLSVLRPREWTAKPTTTQIKTTIHNHPTPHNHKSPPLQAVAVAFCMTFFEFFDVPVYWPILLLYFLSLFILTMKRQIRHMIKHRCVRVWKHVLSTRPGPDTH